MSEVVTTREITVTRVLEAGRDRSRLRLRAERGLRARSSSTARFLGLERSSVWQRADEPPAGAEFETANMTIVVIATEALGIEFSPNTVPVALQVDDVAAARAELGSRGVSFVGETIDSGVWHIANFPIPRAMRSCRATATRRSRARHPGGQGERLCLPRNHTLTLVSWLGSLPRALMTRDGRPSEHWREDGPRGRYRDCEGGDA